MVALAGSESRWCFEGLLGDKSKGGAGGYPGSQNRLLPALGLKTVENVVINTVRTRFGQEDGIAMDRHRRRPATKQCGDCRPIPRGDTMALVGLVR